MDELLKQPAVEPQVTSTPEFDANNRPSPDYLDRVSDGVIRGTHRNINLKGEY